MLDRSPSSYKTPTILLVEDNPADIRLVEEGLREAGIAGKLHSIDDGELALDFLFRRNGREAAPRPDMVLLDLNLPSMGGLEILEAFKKDDKLKAIPTIILTSSDAETDILRAYEGHANCYVTKPVDYPSFVDMVELIKRFWFETARLP